MYLWRRDEPPAVRVTLYAEGYFGFAGTGDEIGPWVTDVLARHADVPAKLLAHTTPDKHAFVWVTYSTSMEIQTSLEAGVSPPTTPPGLPEGVTHVWIASDLRSVHGLPSMVSGSRVVALAGIMA